MTERLYRRYDVNEETPVQFVGMYTLRWQREWGEPTVMFAEVDDPLIDAASQLLEALETLLTHPSDDPSDAVVTEDDYLLTPLQIAERKARIIIAAAKGEK